MRDRLFIDTNILVYSFDKKSPTKQKKAKELLKEFFDREDYFVSIQVLNEFCSAAVKKLNPPLKVERVKDFISSFPERKILPVYRATVLSSLVIMGKYKLSYWDSLIIATSLESKCTILYTEDMQNGLRIDRGEDRLKIVNPFE